MSDVTEQSEPTPIEDGHRMEAIMRDPAVVRAFRRLEEAYFGEFRRAKPEELLHLHAKTIVLQDIRAALQSVVDTGRMAKAQKERDKKLEEVKKREQALRVSHPQRPR